jgi:choline-sulfatase
MRPPKAAAVLVIAILVTALTSLSCSRSEPEQRLYRLSPEPLTPASQAPALPRKVKLGDATRTAVLIPEQSGLSLQIPAGASRLILSFGLAGTNRPNSRPRVVVANATERSSPPLFEADLDPNETGWRDTIVVIRPSGSPRLLSVRVDAPSPPGAAQAQVYLGSPLALTRGNHSNRPSVVMISLDTLGALYLSSFSGPAGISPRLDAFLHGAATFARAYAQYPSTRESHAALFTARYPKTPILGGYDPLAPSTLIRSLALAGFITAAITENAFVSSDFGFDRDFDWYDNGQGAFTWDVPGNASVTFQKAKDWIATYGDLAPFFLFVHTYEVHQPYVPKDEAARQVLRKLDPGYQGRFAEGFANYTAEMTHNAGTAELSGAEIEHLRALYLSEISYLDRVFGEFIDFLDRLPYGDRILLVVLADHGEEFGQHQRLGHGETLYNPALHIPLAFYWRQRSVAAWHEVPVQLIDVMPTVLDVVGATRQVPVDGHSLAQVVLGHAPQPVAYPVFSELHLPVGDCQRLHRKLPCTIRRWAVQDAAFKLIRSEIEPLESFYNLRKDPGESQDLAPSSPDELEYYRKVLDAYQAAPPLTQAPESTPQGAVDQETRDRLRSLGYVQ